MGMLDQQLSCAPVTLWNIVWEEDCMRVIWDTGVAGW